MSAVLDLPLLDVPVPTSPSNAAVRANAALSFRAAIPAADPPPIVKAVITYARKTGARLVRRVGEASPRGEQDPRTVPIRNARLGSGFGLDRSGFEWIAHRGGLREWASLRDRRCVEAVVYPELGALLAQRTGAKKVVALPHTLVDGGDPRPAHNEHNPDWAADCVRRALPAEEAVARLRRRFAIVTAWRPFGAPVSRAALAICDARTIARDDLVASRRLHLDGRTDETCAFACNPQHRWYWLPRQTPDEVLMFKVFDSRADGVARLTAHASFDDPSARPGAPPRRGLEVSALLFW